jgi:hypothetical protein
MPERQKARFKRGEWVKADGVIYDRFDETMIVKTADMPEKFDRYAAGQDFGLNITFVKIGWLGDVVYVLCDYGAFNMTTLSFNEELTARGWFDEPAGSADPGPLLYNCIHQICLNQPNYSRTRIKNSRYYIIVPTGQKFVYR